MRCDNCKERDAIINLTQVEHDTKVTLHLCEQCAQEKGIETGSAVLKSPLGTFLSAMGKGATLPVPADTVRCASSTDAYAVSAITGGRRRVGYRCCISSSRS